MAFQIVDESYHAEAEGRDPKTYGYVEGYTSNTVDDQIYLRLNCKELVDGEKIDWYKRVCKGQIPTRYEFGKGAVPLKPGDVEGQGVRLTRKQVKQLIKELKKWLKRGY